MDKRLENLRMYFPAEVTGAYLAFQSLLKANGVLPAEGTKLMLCVLVGLSIFNVAIYWKFYNVRNAFVQFILLCGFLVWAMNIDTPRFKDVPLGIGANIEIVAPGLLIFYSLLTLFFAIPQRNPDASG
ncbi:hypothetical protein [Bradyrhizobium sp.]|uniref:hypothetical protein n=1 Tax=Bradyrhizobium sp. TaxID=376 RepID=UPI0007C8DCC5|nr:hypothetical protein [Bradyrhizobium sp.]